MNLIMLETTRVAMDGIKASLCEKDKVYDFLDPVGENLIKGGLAVPVTKKQPKVEAKSLGSAPENKKVEVSEDKEEEKKIFRKRR